MCGPFRMNTGSLHVDSSRLCSVCLFPLLTHSAVYLCCVAKINLSYDYDHMLSLMNSSIDTLNVRVVVELRSALEVITLSGVTTVPHNMYIELAIK